MINPKKYDVTSLEQNQELRVFEKLTFCSEKDFEDWCEYWLKKWGWNVQRQVPRDDTKHWVHPYTCDLIISKNSQEPIGIELKNGSVSFAKTLKQIVKKYQNRFFNGRLIKKWAIGVPYFDKVYRGRFALKGGNCRQLSFTSIGNDYRFVNANYFQTFNVGIWEACSLDVSEIVWNPVTSKKSARDSTRLEPETAIKDWF